MQFNFKKTERLKSRKQIDTLFKYGKSIFIYPIKANYIINNNLGNSNTVLFSVPKKNIKKRNG